MMDDPKSTPEEEREQRAAYNALLQSLGPATHEQVAAALAEREPAEPEEGLTPEVIARIRERIAATSRE